MEIEEVEVSLLRLKTSIVKLPFINGDANLNKSLSIKLPYNFEDWHNFKMQFNSLITTNTQLEDSQKLFYLKSALLGSAKQIQTTEDTFDSLFKALEERYDNKRAL